MYAILSHGGRQYRVSAGDRMVVDRLDAQVGSVVGLAPVLLTGGDGKTALGKDIEGMRVAATVVAHRRGEKLRIFKYKAKKRSRKVAGYRSDLTELRVESILAKGAALPKAAASSEPRTSARTAPSRGAPTPKAAVAGSSTQASSAAPTEAAAATPKPSATPKAAAAATKPKAAAATAATKPKAAAKTDAAAKPKSTAKPKPATKRAPKKAGAGNGDGDGA